MPLVPCPRCRTELDADDADLGHTVECPQCQAIFPAIAPSRLRHRDEYAPPRRDDRFHDEPHNRARDERIAQALVDRPANALATASAIAIVVFLIGAAVAGVVGMDMINNGGAQKEDGILLVVLALLFGIFGPIYHIIMFIGAKKVCALQGTGWGYAAAGLGIASIGLWGPCTVVTMFTTAFGVWLLLAISKQEVTRVVRRNQGEAPRHRGSPLREDNDAPR